MCVTQVQNISGHGIVGHELAMRGAPMISEILHDTTLVSMYVELD